MALRAAAAASSPVPRSIDLMLSTNWRAVSLSLSLLPTFDGLTTRVLRASVERVKLIFELDCLTDCVASDGGNLLLLSKVSFRH